MDTSLVIAGIPAVALIIALTGWLKEVFGWQGKSAAILALVLGQVVALGALASQRWPAVADWFTAAVVGLTLTLIAMGAYGAQKVARESPPTPEPEEPLP